MSDEMLPENADDSATAVADQEKARYQMNLTVDVQNTGAWKRKVSVSVPPEDIQHFRKETLSNMLSDAQVPGFRAGKAPQRLVEKQYKKELTKQVKQQVLFYSLEQLTEQHKLDPINEPDLDFDNLEIPDEGPFEYSFEVEVRPEFALPDWKSLTIKRPSRDISEEDVTNYREDYLGQYGQLQEQERAVQAGDYLNVELTISHNGKELRHIEGITLAVRPKLQFTDGVLEGFADLLTGANVGDVREASVRVSEEAPNLELRGEEVQLKFQVNKVNTLAQPELDKAFLERIGVETAEELDDQIHAALKRQVEYQQRQSIREQILGAIVESATWELPEELLERQVENAMRREILEMQQAGFTQPEIQARENQLRQRALTTTRENLKEHFVLDKLATEQKIQVDPREIDLEIHMMALQRGESPRRVRARMEKSGMIENLFAQIRERKAVDYIKEQVTFTDTEMDSLVADRNVESVNLSLCGLAVTESVAEEAGEEDADA